MSPTIVYKTTPKMRTLQTVIVAVLVVVALVIGYALGNQGTEALYYRGIYDICMDQYIRIGGNGVAEAKRICRQAVDEVRGEDWYNFPPAWDEISG